MITATLLAIHYFDRPPTPIHDFNPFPFSNPYMITNLDWSQSTHRITFLVTNNGDNAVTLKEVYVNGSLDAEAAIFPEVLPPNLTAVVNLSETFLKRPSQITVKVVTSDGINVHYSKHFYEIQLEKVEWDENTGQIRAFVKNLGDESVAFRDVYVNGQIDKKADINPLILQSGQTAEITLSGTFRDTQTAIPIKVTTLQGASDEQSYPIFRIWIQSINWIQETGEIKAFAYSQGYEKPTITGVYINGVLDLAALVRDDAAPSTLYTITLSKTYNECPAQLTLRVVAANGVFAELSQRPNTVGHTP